MKTEITVFSVDHYSMEDNQGCNVRILGDRVHTNNKFGVEVSKAAVPYSELAYLAENADKLPAVFSASLSFTTVKDRNGNERAGVSLSNLKYVKGVTIQ